MEHGTTNNTMDQSPNKKYPLRKKRHAAHHVSDRPAINEHASERAPSASTGTREGRVGSPPTAKSKQRKPFNQSGLHEARTEETVWQICKTKKIQQPSTIDRNPLTILKTQTDIFIDTNKLEELEDATSQKQLGKEPSEKRSRSSEQRKTGDADLDGIGINPKDSRRDRCWRSHHLPETKAGEACKMKHSFPEKSTTTRESESGQHR